MAAWQAAGLPVARLPLAGLAGVQGRRVLDVRQDAEFAAGHIPGAAHVELGALTHQPGGLPGGPLAVVCGHGERAMTAASLLQRQGRAEVSVVGGGTSAWAAAGRRLEPHR
jgi:rhodanese-related sulfurtransferase